MERKVVAGHLAESEVKTRLIPGGSDGKASAYSAGDLDSIPGLGRYPGERKVYSLQSSGLENSVNCVVHGVTKSRTRLGNFHFISFSNC